MTLAKSPVSHLLRKVAMNSHAMDGSGSGQASPPAQVAGSPGAGLMRKLSASLSRTTSRERRTSITSSSAAEAAPLRYFWEVIPTADGVRSRNGRRIGQEDTDVELAQLQNELAGIAAQRERVAARYEERLTSLRTTLRSALIREKAAR